MNRSTLRQREDEVVHQMLAVRDKLQEIFDDRTKRGRRVSQYDAEPGHRPLKPIEVKYWIKHCIDRLNIAVNRFHDTYPKPWDWEKFENKD